MMNYLDRKQKRLHHIIRLCSVLEAELLMNRKVKFKVIFVVHPGHIVRDVALRTVVSLWNQILETQYACVARILLHQDSQNPHIDIRDILVAVNRQYPVVFGK